MMRWKDEATQLECMIRQGFGGIWCGYVGLEPDHPLYGHDYNDIDVDVHGGLTWAGPWEFVTEDLWWLGFDCGHAFDAVPGIAEWPVMPEATYRDEAYAKAETQRLARQLARVTS